MSSTVSASEPILTADNSFHDGNGGDATEAGIVDSVTDLDSGTLKTSAITLSPFDAVNGGLIGTAGRLETIAVGDLYLHNINTADLATD